HYRTNSMRLKRRPRHRCKSFRANLPQRIASRAQFECCPEGRFGYPVTDACRLVFGCRSLVKRAKRGDENPAHAAITATGCVHARPRTLQGVGRAGRPAHSTRSALHAADDRVPTHLGLTASGTFYSRPSILIGNLMPSPRQPSFRDFPPPAPSLFQGL